MPEIIIIVAVAKDRVIGKAGTIPWDLPEDMAYFKRATMGHTVIMGRKTYDSIGHPLPGRTNIIVSRSMSLKKPCSVVSSLEAAISHRYVLNESKLFIIGGAEIYKQAMPIADTILLTSIERLIEGGDTFFPTLDPAVWGSPTIIGHGKQFPRHAYLQYRRQQPLG